MKTMEERVMDAHNETLALCEDYSHCISSFVVENSDFTAVEKQLIIRRSINLMFQQTFGVILDYSKDKLND